MTRLAVGEKFPAAYHKHDSMALALAEASFDVILSMGNPTGKESQAFCKGKLRIGAAVVKDIPFVVLDCPGLGTFDASLNLLLEAQEKRNAFLVGEPEANLVTLFLVDNQTDIIRGMRTLGLSADFMRIIKEAAFAQAATYTSGAEVYTAIQKILAEHSTERLIGLAHIQVFKGG